MSTFKPQMPVSDLARIRASVNAQVIYIPKKMQSIESQIVDNNISDALSIQIEKLKEIVSRDGVVIYAPVPTSKQTLKFYQDIESRICEFNELYPKVMEALSNPDSYIEDDKVLVEPETLEDVDFRRVELQQKDDKSSGSVEFVVTGPFIEGEPEEYPHTTTISEPTNNLSEAINLENKMRYLEVFRTIKDIIENHNAMQIFDKQIADKKAELKPDSQKIKFLEMVGVAKFNIQQLLSELEGGLAEHSDFITEQIKLLETQLQGATCDKDDSGQ